MDFPSVRAQHLVELPPLEVFKKVVHVALGNMVQW